MDENKKFREFVYENVRKQGLDKDFIGLTNIWVKESINHNYAQNFTWLDRPVIQVPQDIYAIQEIIWNVKPDLVIETGIAHGGSLILSASMLALIDYCEAVASNSVLDPMVSKRKVLGVDVDIRAHNREAIESHPMNHKIEMIQGSSIEHNVINQVKNFASEYNNIMVFLDSNHTHDHVLAELEAYAPLVSKESYCVVWDSGVENLPAGFVTDRPWGKGNNPKTAAIEYLKKLQLNDIKAADGDKLIFEIDEVIEDKIVISACSDGFLRRC